MDVHLASFPDIEMVKLFLIKDKNIYTISLMQDCNISSAL